MTLKQLIGTAIALTFCLPMAVMAQNPDVQVPIAGSNALNDSDDATLTSDNDIADLDVQDNFQDNSADQDNDNTDVDVQDNFQDNSDTRTDLAVDDSFQDNSEAEGEDVGRGVSAANNNSDAETDSDNDADADNDSAAASNNSTANTDNDTDTEFDSDNDVDTDNASAGASNNSSAEVDNSTEFEFEVEIEDSFNTDNSLDIRIENVALNSNIMGATVSGNNTLQLSTNLGRNNEIEAENTIDDSFGGAAGITQTGQNLGINSVMQQNVSVNSKVGN